jgi:hypothetical protein
MLTTEQITQIVADLESKKLLKDIIKTMNIEAPLQQIVQNLKTAVGQERIISLIKAAREANGLMPRHPPTFESIATSVRNMKDLTPAKIDEMIANLQAAIVELNAKKMK